MEFIWNDLSTQITSAISPNWHQNILLEREQTNEQPLNWEIAKQKLSQKLKN